jgi:glutaredoxin
VTRKVTLYTRAGCPLCETAEQWIEKARRGGRFELEVLDIDDYEALHDRYNDRVPVVALDGIESFWGRIDERALMERLQS